MTFNSTIKRKSGECSSCGEDRIFAHNSKRLCQYCNERRKREEKKQKGKAPYKYKRKKTGELELFKKIWNEREHRCSNCGVRLPLFRVHYFAHIKSKGSRPDLRLNEDNIVLMCFDFGNFANGCHYLFDHGTQEQFEARRNIFQ